MINVYMIFITVFFIGILFKYINQCKLNRIKQDRIDELTGTLRIYMIQNEVLERQLNRKTNNINCEVVEAVRYAMIHAHPDNGGDSDTFIKYRKLYKSIVTRGD